jgi:UDP-glucuronate decarboxylase
MRNRVVEEDLARITSADLPWHTFEGKTVLISGANGFLPAYIVETLLYLNEIHGPRTKIVGLVRSKQKAISRFNVYQGRDDLEFIVQDVCHPILTTKKVDFVIHAASQSSPKYFGKDPVGTMSANLLGTHNLLSFAKENNSEGFLFFSTGEVYGEVEMANIPTKETEYGYLDPATVRSCYAESKRAAETMCIAWFHQFGVPAKIVRPFHTYGPGMSLDDGRVFSDFVADIVGNNDIVMRSDGSAKRAFCYLADATLGFLTVLLNGENGQAYNVGNENAEVTVLDLARRLAALFPSKGLNVVTHTDVDREGYLKSGITRSCPDTSKIRALGWKPITPIEAGFRRTIESFL